MRTHQPQPQSSWKATAKSKPNPIEVSPQAGLESTLRPAPERPWGMMAANVRRSATQPTIQRHAGHDHPDEELQMQPTTAHPVVADHQLEHQLKATQGQGQPLDATVQHFMESRFGTSFDQISIHTGTQSIQMNQQLHSQAFTLGNDIHFNAGKYSPHTHTGKKLLAHELTHTIQQTGGATLQQQPESGAHGQNCACATCSPGATIQRQVDLNQHSASCPCPTCSGQIQTKLTIGPPGDHYERQADQMANQVMGMSADSVAPAPSSHRHQVAAPDSPVAIQRQPLVNQISAKSAAGPGVIQRHSSHEHYLLGQASPDELANISFMRAAAQARRAETLTLGMTEYQDYLDKHNSVKHSIVQHLTLLQNFINQPDFLETKANRKAQDGQTTLDPGEIYQPTQDALWEIPYIALPVKANDSDQPASDSTVVMYGELNALPDFFSNPTDIAQTPKRKVLGFLQGIRQRVYKNLLHWYNDEIIWDPKEAIPDATGTADRATDIDGKITKKRQTANVFTRTATVGLIGVDTVKKRNRADFMLAKGPKDVDQTETNKGYIKGNAMGTELHADQASRDGGKASDQAYFAALERNACHFAPYSWEAWESYHEKALTKAKEANQYNATADMFANIITSSQEYNFETPIKQQNVDEQRELARDSINQALLLNAFGDHFLQDSYAAGHLVDKTLIMQKFAQWMIKTDAVAKLLGPEDVQQMVKMIADQADAPQPQQLKSDPQAFQDKIQSGDFHQKASNADTELPHEKAAKFLGLAPEAPIIFLMWWRRLAANDAEVLKDVTAFQILNLLKHDDDITDLIGVPQSIQDLEYRLLAPLVELGFIKQDKQKEDSRILQTSRQKMQNHLLTKYSINQAVLRQITGTARIKGKMRPAYVSAVAEVDPKNYPALAAEFKVEAYMRFMERTIVQTISNHFHDIYCKQGLEVYERSGQAIGLIYGDKEMLSKGAAKGVKHSGETGQLSRNAVIKTMQGIPLDNQEITRNIAQRFPGEVQVEHKRLKLEQWNREILAQDQNFQDAFDNNPKIKKLKVAKNVGVEGMNLIGNRQLFADIKPLHPEKPQEEF